jgi:predicted AlkP superfamily pyrophosphatase or phosphodiesterase
MARRVLLIAVALVVSACGGVRPGAPPPPQDAFARASGGINRPEQRDKPHVILISFDGFRADYLDRPDLPNFRRAMQRGTRARAMLPVFPSLTFPNHYSLVTGLHPDRHGIVANSFYDPIRNRRYSLSDRGAVTDATWYRGEPIWVTAETQGMVSACFFWPGSEAAIGGVRPTFWNEYDDGVSSRDRIDGVLQWLRLSDERRPHVITLYFSDLDSASHDGPLNSPEITQALRTLDRTLGSLVEGVNALPIRDRIYLVLTSDHGMVETNASQTVALDSIADMTGVQVGFAGPVTSLHIAAGAARALEVRNQLNSRLQHGRAYLRQDLPQRFRFSADPRAGDVVVVMDESWTLSASRLTQLANRVRRRWGAHGWDPALPSMHAMFLVVGPDIRAGATVEEVNNVDVYPFLTELLELQPAREIDGRAGWISARVMDPASRRIRRTALHPAPGGSYIGQ